MGRTHGQNRNLLFVAILITVLLLCACFFGKALIRLNTPDAALDMSTVFLGNRGNIFLSYADSGLNRIDMISKTSDKAQTFSVNTARDADKYLIGDIYELTDGKLLVTVYELSDGAVGSVSLYSVSSDYSEEQLLITYECGGLSSAENLFNYRFFEISDTGDAVWILGSKAGEATLYKYSYRELVEFASVYTVALSDSVYGAALLDAGDEGVSPVILLALGDSRFLYTNGDTVCELGRLDGFLTSALYSTNDAIYAVNSLDNQLYSISAALSEISDESAKLLPVHFGTQLPVSLNGTLYIPFDPILNALGLDQTADEFYGYRIDDSGIYIDGQPIELANPIYMVGSTRMISGEALDMCFNVMLIYQSEQWMLAEDIDNLTFSRLVLSSELIPAGTSTLLGRYSDYSLNLDTTSQYDINMAGDALMRTSDNKLILSYSSGEVFDASEYLKSKSFPAPIIYIAVLIAAIFISAFIHYVYVVRRNSYLPLALRQGIVVLIFSLLVFYGTLNYFIEPKLQRYTLDSTREAALELAKLESSGSDTDKFPELGENAVGWTLIECRDNSSFAVTKSNLGIQSGSGVYSVGQPNPDIEEQLTEFYATGDSMSDYYRLNNYIWSETIYLRSADNGSVLAVYLSPVRASGLSELMTRLYVAAFGASLIVFVISLIAGARIAHSVKLVGKGMDLISQGELDMELVLHTGDEVQTLAAAFDGAVRYFSETFENLTNLNSAYIRFVPQRLVKLLGETTVENIGKNSHTSAEMIAMSVYFEFGDDRYEHTTNELFDNINLIIEKISSIISNSNGIVYNFNSDGVEAVFDINSTQAISAAVQISTELNQLNRERRERGDNTVDVYIALDRGNVMLGIIGDDARMIPTAISASLTTARMLNRLGRKTDTRILCTENMVSEFAHYHSRYVGKTSDGMRLIRLYEVYDGDRAAVITSKDSSLTKFEDGIFAFYGRNFAEAREIFMDILKHHSSDGMARQYLYMSDVYTRVPPDPDTELCIGSQDREV